MEEQLRVLEEQVLLLQEQVASLSTAHRQLMKEVEVMKRQASFIYCDEFSLGNGAEAVKMTSEGFWVGTRSFTEATSIPPAGTAIALNGDFYPKDGVDGTYVDGGGQTLTITRGIITGIA